MRDAARQALRRARPLSRSAAATGILVVLALLGANSQVTPITQVANRLTMRSLASAAPTMNAFGASGEVKVRFARPNASLEMPLQVAGDPTQLRYEWLPLDDSAAVAPARNLEGAEVVTPEQPGLYRLALSAQGSVRRVVQGLTVGVLVPFEEKQGRSLNGYRMGMWRGERHADARAPLPAGFLEVRERDADRPLTRHIRVSDFLTHDGQSQWPRYVAVDTRLLDKLELVLAQLEADQGGVTVGGEAPRFAMEVRSGFRTPFHNARVPGSARDSRHQSGEAVDVAIDADRDGRFTRKDLRLVVKALEEVEAQHPDLVGGIGLYTSRRFSSPYVHMDVRGDHVRWRG
ncbi:MAG: DUF882 domain-containing protein [Gemmatimonadetes bacterium]|nr:DUF882 domain-containing protein [Gemmatimonadota bacterium]